MSVTAEMNDSSESIDEGTPAAITAPLFRVPDDELEDTMLLQGMAARFGSPAPAPPVTPDWQRPDPQSGGGLGTAIAPVPPTTPRPPSSVRDELYKVLSLHVKRSSTTPDVVSRALAGVPGQIISLPSAPLSALHCELEICQVLSPV